MNYFDFSEQVCEQLARTKNLEEELSARTTVGKREFPAAVKRAGLRFLGAEARAPVDSSPTALVIGIATWSDPDLEALERYVARSHSSPDDVFVFDVDDAVGLAETARVLPQAPLYMWTPVVGVYDNSRLSQFFQGKEAIAFLRGE